MFLEFYKLREQPFGVTPDPRFIYFGAAHREALASLLYAVESKRGFSALVAEPGMGKTSLLFRMLDSLQSSARTAFLFQTEGDSRELLRSLLHDLGINAADQDRVTMHEALNQGLHHELHSGRQVVVVIDEAQNLDDKVLETIRLLSNFETPQQKLMHIVLAGQPALSAKLSEAGMAQLRQRVSTIIRLEPFRDDEVVKYIDHRLRAAGNTGPSVFSPEALEMIARASKGIPRNINSLCFQSLSIGFATQSKRIGAEIVREVVADLNFTPDRNDRINTQEPLRRPSRVSESFHSTDFSRPRRPEPIRMSDIPRRGGWDYVHLTPPRASRMKWIAAIACIAILPASVIALSDTKFGLTQTLPGQVSEKVVNAVLSSNDSNADFVPAWLEKLKPPQAPLSVDSLNNASPSSASNDPADLAGVISGKKNQQASETGQEPSTQSINENHDRTATAIVEKVGRSDGKRNLLGRPQFERSGVPTSVQVLRPETVFQFALELYGQSNWKIIEAICAANPGVHDPYTVLTTGQWIRLPSDLESVTANYNSHAIYGRPR